MTLTPAIVNSTISLKTVFTVGNTGASNPNTVVISDQSVWSNIVSASTDKVNIILQIIDPSGFPCYQNPGWATSTFTSPDLFYGTVPITSTPSIVLPNDSNGNLLTGTYTVNAQVQVIQNYASTPIITLGSGLFAGLLNSAYLQKFLSPTMNFAPNYFYANMTVSDATNYGTYTSITYSLTVVPPVQANQANFTSNTNSLLVTNLWAPAPYQGELQNIVYYNAGSLVETISYINYFQDYNTLNSLDLCGMYCCMKIAIAKRDSWIGKSTPEFERWNQIVKEGALLILMCNEAVACNDGASVARFQQEFNKITQCDCCKCECNLTPTPVIPVTPTQGPPGNNGISVTNAQIINGNLIITLSNNTQINAGAIPAGANGTNGAYALWPAFFATPATSTTSQSIPAFAITNIGDEILITTDLVLTASLVGSYNVFFSIAGNSSTIAIQAQSPNTVACTVYTRIEYSAANTITVQNRYVFYKPTSPRSSINDWEAEVKEVSPFTLAFNPSIANNFTVDLSQAGGFATISMIEGLLAKINVTGGAFPVPLLSAPIYATGNNSATYQNNQLIGLSNSKFIVQIDGATMIPGTDYNLDVTYGLPSVTGTITRIGGTISNTQSIVIIPVI